MCDPILVTLLKMRPHYSHFSRENATPYNGTSPLASYKMSTGWVRQEMFCVGSCFKFWGGRKQTKSLLLNLMNFLTISLWTDSPTSGKLSDLNLKLPNFSAAPSSNHYTIFVFVDRHSLSLTYLSRSCYKSCTCQHFFRSCCKTSRRDDNTTCRNKMVVGSRPSENWT